MVIKILKHQHEPDWMSECAECISLANQAEEEQGSYEESIQ